MNSHLSDIVSFFKIDENVTSINKIGSGLINDTYQVITNGQRSYILQKVNHHIFKDIEGLSNNIRMVTSHLANKIDRKLTGNILTEKLELIATRKEKYFHKDDKGNFWRMYNFIENSFSYDSVDSTFKAFQTGFAFGKFQMLLADLPANELIEIIPIFIT